MPKFVVDKYRLGIFNNGGVRKAHIRQQDSLQPLKPIQTPKLKEVPYTDQGGQSELSQVELLEAKVKFLEAQIHAKQK
jgi:hypothetical protein